MPFYNPTQSKWIHHRIEWLIRRTNPTRFLLRLQYLPPDPPLYACWAACSRKVHELRAAGREDVILHCLPNGNYDSLQCDRQVCFCVNSTTGQPYGATVARNMWKGLPCCE